MASRLSRLLGQASERSPRELFVAYAAGATAIGAMSRIAAHLEYRPGIVATSALAFLFYATVVAISAARRSESLIDATFTVAVMISCTSWLSAVVLDAAVVTRIGLNPVIADITTGAAGAFGSWLVLMIVALPLVAAARALRSHPFAWYGSTIIVGIFAFAGTQSLLARETGEIVYARGTGVARVPVYVDDGKSVSVVYSDSLGRFRVSVTPDRRNEYRLLICPPGAFPYVVPLAGKMASFNTGYGVSPLPKLHPPPPFLNGWEAPVPAGC